MWEGLRLPKRGRTGKDIQEPYVGSYVLTGNKVTQRLIRDTANTYM